MRTSLILKIVSFILLPIFCIGIIGSCMVLYRLYENTYKTTYEIDLDYISTQDYFNELDNILKYYQNNKNGLKQINNYSTLTVKDIENFENSLEIKESSELVEYYYNTYSESKLKYLIIDLDGFQFTNISDSEVNKDNIIDIMNNSDFYYYITSNNKETNLNVDYLQKYNMVLSKHAMTGIKEIYTYTDYDTLIGEHIKRQETYKLEQEKIDEIVNILQPYAAPTLIISSIFTISIVVFLFLSLGHKKGYEGIYLNSLDKWSLEFFIGVSFCIFYIACTILCELLPINISLVEIDKLFIGYLFEIIIIILVCISIYVLLAITLTSLLKRIKSKTLFKSTLTYMIIKYFFKKILPFIQKTFASRSITFKLIAIYGIVCFLSLIFTASLYDENVFLFISFISLACIAVYVVKKGIEFKYLQSIIESIYNGNEYKQTDDNKFTGEFKKSATHLENISGGFSTAIQESLKSERLKTELITNVSHDIKTPLTSIINYVDLLKKEDIDNEKVKEYLDILDNKSQRLKKLTEDLVEASKANSGNIRLTMEKINVCELIKQINAEFEEKFKERQLILITDGVEIEKYIYADSRYMYRVLENLYTNISKYALIGSRVYVNISEINKKINIIIKNISQDKLNITAEELIERFVRGDSSRNTEGSGLGLSISEGLTKLQNGKFEIALDGDLFKVILEFDELV